MSFSKLIISSNGNVDIETRFFLDDLTDHIQKKYKLHQFDFLTTTSNGTKALQHYLLDNFYLKQNRKKIKLLITNVSFSKNQLILVVNISANNKLDLSKEVFLVNTLLCDSYPIQINHIKFLNKDYKLNIGKPKIKIEIN